jgi:hypothetical protein
MIETGRAERTVSIAAARRVYIAVRARPAAVERGLERGEVARPEHDAVAGAGLDVVDDDLALAGGREVGDAERVLGGPGDTSTARQRPTGR